MDGYVDKKKHTTRSEVVRVEVKYVPSAKTGKELPISIELTSNSNYELPSSIKVNGTSVALTGDGYYYSKNVKVRPNEESLIEFTVNVSGRLNKVTSFNIYIATANQGYGQPFPAKHQGQAFINNALVATNKFDSKAYNDVIQELEAPADKVEQVEVPYETVYKADPELLGGQRQVEKKGVSGQKTVITTHVLGANNQFVAKTSEEITKQPEAEIVRVGTKAETTTEAIPFVTVYEEDPTMKVTDKEVIAVAGVAGQKVTTKTYTLNEQTGELTTQETVKVTDPVNQVIKHGPSGEINYQTEYRENKNLTAGETKVIQAGKKGASTKVYDPVNGTATATFSPKTEASVTREPQLIVVLVENSGVVDMYLSTDVSKLAPLWDKMEDGDKLLWISALRIPEKFDDAKASYSVKGQDTAIKPLESIGTITADPMSLPTDPEVIEQVGKAGKQVTTTKYKVDRKTGAVTALEPTVETTPAVDQIVKRGTGKTTIVAKPTKYVANVELANKTTREVVAGVDGVVHPNGKVLTEVVARVIEVGTKPVVVETAIEPQVIYQDDPTMKKDDPEVIVVPGTAGKTIETTTFTVNEQTGEVSSSTAVETIKAIDHVIKRGSGEENQIPYQTRYEADETMANGTTAVKVAGQVGIEHPNGTVTKEPVTEIILVGTKPEVVVEELDFTILCEADPTLPVGTTVIVQAGEKGQKIKTITYRVDEETGELIAEETEEVIAPVTQLVKQETKVEEPQPEVKPVAKVETPKAQPKVELPQTGDVNENNLSLLGLLGLTGAGLLAVGRRKRQIK